MSTTPAPKRVINLEGLKFDPGNPFSSKEMAERLYSLLLGSDHAKAGRSIPELRTQATEILLAIFSVCLRRVETFLSLQNSTLGWQIVAGDFAEHKGSTLTAPEVEELVRVFGDARSRFLASLRGEATITMTSELTKSIDRWLDANRQHDLSPSPATAAATATTAAGGSQAQLVLRPAQQPLENILAGVSLASNPNTGDTPRDWPPTHLPPSDLQVLQHPKIRERLAGVTWQTKGAMPNLLTEKTDELGLRLFLGWLGEAHSTPTESTFTLYMLPVAFPTNKERQAWYDVSGWQSKKFGHLAGFLAYAAEAFKNGKGMALGLPTPFFCYRSGGARAGRFEDGAYRR